MAWLLVPDGLIYSDVSAQPTLEIPENYMWKRKYPASGSFVDENALLVSVVNE